MKTNVHFWSYLTQFFLEWEMFQTNILETIKAHIAFSINFFFENSAVEKYCREGQATDNNMAHVHCMLDN